MNLTGKNLIAGEASGKGKETFYAQNPSNGLQLQPLFTEATTDEINEAVAKARSAFDDYRRKTGQERAVFLDAIAEEIMDLGDDLIYRCMEETALPDARLKNERGRTVNQLKLFASYLREGSWVDARIDHADAKRVPPKPDLRSMQRPLGPVGVFGASNFPLAFSVAGGDTASALAAGCPVIFKGHPSHPGTSEMVAGAIRKAIRKTSMPAGTFSLVQGRSIDVGMALVKHPDITAIGFTGSFRGGKAIFDAANSRSVPIPVYAEMGSTNPVFILPEALKEKKEIIARDLAGAVTLGVGQFCTNPGLVIVPEGSEEKIFTDALSKAISEYGCGTMLNQSIHSSYRAGVVRLEKSKGVKTLAKGKEEGKGSVAGAYLFQTSGKRFLSEKTLQEEVFGPSTLSVVVDDKKQLMQVAIALDGHLTATIHATEKDLDEYADLIAILEQKVGRLILNGYPTGVEVSHAMVHGGPYPATTDSRTTSVGTDAIRRFTRPLCYQNFPPTLLPAELRDENVLGIWRLVDGQWKNK